MKKICAWCGKDMGDIPPYEDEGVTHTMCEECYKKWRKAKRISLLRRKRELKRQ